MKVKFLPQNVEIEIKPNQSVMNLAHENGITIHSVCNGMPSCAECRIRVVEGDYNVLPPGRKELNLIGTGYFIDQRRLACQLYCFGDITVDLTEQIEKSKESLVPKKFLQRANKENAEEYHSVGGVLIEDDIELIKQAEAEVPSRGAAAGPIDGDRVHEGRPGEGQGGGRPSGKGRGEGASLQSSGAGSRGDRPGQGRGRRGRRSRQRNRR